jgi:hypothetical protein
MTDRYYHQYCDILHRGQAPPPDMTIQGIYLLLAVVVNGAQSEGHIIRVQ